MKKKKQTKIKPIPTEELKFYVKIIHHSYSHITREASESEWDGDDISYENTIDGFQLVNEKGGWDFIINENPTGNWYLVYVLHTDGDSFHHEENCLALVAFVKDIEDAKVILEAVKMDYKEYTEKERESGFVTVDLPVSNKKEKIYTGNWKGYFNHLTSIQIEGLTETVKFTI